MLVFILGTDYTGGLRGGIGVAHITDVQSLFNLQYQIVYSTSFLPDCVNPIVFHILFTSLLVQQ